SASTRCASWVRFNSDHTLVDEMGTTGTWQLRSYGLTTGSLTLTLGNLPPRTTDASRSSEDVLGFPGPRYWNRATCWRRHRAHRGRHARKTGALSGEIGLRRVVGAGSGDQTAP